MQPEIDSLINLDNFSIISSISSKRATGRKTSEQTKSKVAPPIPFTASWVRDQLKS